MQRMVSGTPFLITSTLIMYISGCTSERFCKNLFLKDRKGGFWLLVCLNDQVIRDRYLAELYAVEAKYPEDLATVKDFADHIDHAVNLIGIDYVGIGTDFDGGGGLRDCWDASELPNITAELLRRGYSKDDLERFWGGNFMRVFKQVIERAKGNI